MHELTIYNSVDLPGYQGNNLFNNLIKIREKSQIVFIYPMNVFYSETFNCRSSLEKSLPESIYIYHDMIIKAFGSIEN